MAGRGTKKKGAKPAAPKARGKSSSRAKAAKPTRPAKSRSSADARTLQAALGEALKQQAATAEILRIISRSPGDTQPVFDAIAANALRLCGATFSTCCRFDGKLIHLAAFHHLRPRGVAAFHKAYPSPPSRNGITQRAILTSKLIHVADVLKDREYVYHYAAQEANYRSVLAVPMLRNGVPIGAVSVFRDVPERFPDTKVQLLKTFADQAVIAIENARLFSETNEALDQQTATAEILQAISSSPGNLQPVLDTLVHAAAKFCAAPDVLIMRLDHDVMRGAAATGLFADVLAREAGAIHAISIPVTRESVSGRAVVDRRMLHVHDLAAEREDDYPEGLAMQRRFGHRTLAAMPLLREGAPIGVIVLFRTEVRPFSDKQLQLLRLFADQAVIAIENVRLFHTLEVKNRDLTEALEQQTATSDILRVISRSPTDVQPVFETIVKAALSLCRAHSATVLTLDREMLHVGARALAGATTEEVDAIQQMFPRPAGRETAAGRAILTRKLVVIPDVLEDADYRDKSAAIRGGFRSAVAVPLMRDGNPIGTINIGLRHAGSFPEKQLALLQTFADQAVIAIENVRLFKELDARNRDLTEALEQQTATGEVLKVISRSTFDLQPVLQTVIDNAVRVCGAEHGHIHRFDGEFLRLAAGHSANAEMLEYLRANPNRLGGGTLSGMAGLERRPIHCHDVLTIPGYTRGEAQRLSGFRTVLAVPILSADALLGVIMIWKTRVEPFAEKQIELVAAFADQAAIAIENVRLFKELEARNRDLTEALEHQTATSEILRIISSSPTDVQPVFDIIGERAAKLCDAQVGVVTRVVGEQIHLAAIHGVNAKARQALRRYFPADVRANSASSRAFRDRAPVNIPDVFADVDYDSKATASDGGWCSCLAVPMFHEGQVIGTVFVGRSQAGRFADSKVDLLKTFADQAVIAIENVRLFTELEARNRDLTEALEQQTATSEILRAISRSPTDVQPVFDAIVQSAVKLCGADHSIAVRFDGERLHPLAHHGFSAEALEVLARNFPMLPGPETTTQRVVLTGSIVNIPDTLTDPGYSKEYALAGGFRSTGGVPMLRDGRLIGAIGVGRKKPGAFPDRLITLLQTFADQAVIAIENVRLFKELEARNRDLTESLEQQTATSEILSVISKSQTDVQPVFDTIAAAALRLCSASSVNVFMVEGGQVHIAALVNATPEGAEAVRRSYPRPIGRDNGASRAVLTRDVVVIPDIYEDPEFGIRETAQKAAFRSVLAVPLMRDQQPIGAIAVGREQPGAFPDKQISLLKTFADQAMIAIENVRLFRELQVRNGDLTEALEQQTATSEILSVISQSPTDVRPVFEAIAAAALKLCRASLANVFRFDGDLLHLEVVKNVNADPGYFDAISSVFPRPAGRETGGGRAVVARDVVEIPDVEADPEYGIGAQTLAGGFRSVLGVPLMRGDKALGSITVCRPEPERFPRSQITLLQTFADQAVIAIENVHLFKQLESRNHDLTEALEQQTATSEILRVISKSQTDVQPVFDTIVRSAVSLCGGLFAIALRYDGALLHYVAGHNVGASYVDLLKSKYPRQPDVSQVSGRVILDNSLVTLEDARADPDYDQQFPAAMGWRRMLGVPMMREGKPVGVIAVAWAEPGPVPKGQQTLLQTFADQAVIAIENVRLFTELEARNRDITESLEQQTATSEILRVISQSPTDVRPVFETIAEAAMKLCRGNTATVVRFDGKLVDLVALASTWSAEDKDALRRMYPKPPSRETVASRAVLARSVVNIPDVQHDPEYAIRNVARSAGYKSAVGVPLTLHGAPIGAIGVGRPETGLFPEKQIALLKTFADQAVIAIENVRLFNELKARTAELTRSVSELKALGEVGQAVSSTLDLETVLRTIVSRATELAGMDGGSIWEYDEEREEFHVHATDRLPDELVEVLRATPIRKGEGALGRLAVTSEPVSIRDFADEKTYKSRLRNALIRTGFHSVFAVPLLRENHLLGALAVNRKAAGEFDDALTELLKTFAGQSALAIQNARLFREIELKSRELETASRHKSEFLANMSHELRTPLNAIIGFSEVLYERMFGDINEKQAEYLGDILESGRHLLSLINDILDLSKIEAGRMELEPSDFHLPSAIENTLILVRERAQRRGVELGRTIDGALGTVRGDERKVKQVLLNLLSNALKFTPEGGRIDVRARAHDGVAEISVTDTGVGIAVEDQQAVFEEFKQVGSASKKVEGTGLGLAISRKFIELHGGRIWVESEVGKGATFTFTLPHRTASA